MGNCFRTPSAPHISARLERELASLGVEGTKHVVQGKTELDVSGMVEKEHHHRDSLGSTKESSDGATVEDLEAEGQSISGEGEWGTGSSSSWDSSGCREEVEIEPEASDILEITATDIYDYYDFGRELGRGQFGVTFLCAEKATGDKVACKSILKRPTLQMDDMRREIAIMQHLPPHPNIVKLRDVHEDKDAVHLVMEECQGGELFDRIVDQRMFSEREAAETVRTILEIVAWFHKHNVMHRDLKPENFLYAKAEEGSALKAIDFGLSCFFQEGEKFQDVVGSPYYMAPELLEKKYGPQIDLWSAGVILYILLSGMPPFCGENEVAVMMAIRNSEVDLKRDPWPWVSKEAKSLISQLLERDVSKRPTALEALEHPWLKNASKATADTLGTTVLHRLQQFADADPFESMVLRMIAKATMEDDCDGSMRLFRMLDMAGKTWLGPTELRGSLSRVGCPISDKEARRLVDILDSCRNGSIGCIDFVAATMGRKRVLKKESLQRVFSRFDRECKGYFDVEDLTIAFESGPHVVPQEIAEAIFTMLDFDKTGKITFPNFIKIMRRCADCQEDIAYSPL